METVMNLFGFSLVESSQDTFAARLIGRGRVICSALAEGRDLDQNSPTIRRVWRTLDQSGALQTVHDLGHGARRADDLLGEHRGGKLLVWSDLQHSQHRKFAEREHVIAETFALQRLQKKTRPRQAGEESERARLARLRVRNQLESRIGCVHVGCAPEEGVIGFAPVEAEEQDPAASGPKIEVAF